MELKGASHREDLEQRGGGGIYGKSKRDVGEIKDQHNDFMPADQSMMILRTKA